MVPGWLWLDADKVLSRAAGPYGETKGREKKLETGYQHARREDTDRQVDLLDPLSLRPHL
jgi:hypothetical protein